MSTSTPFRDAILAHLPTAIDAALREAEPEAANLLRQAQNEADGYASTLSAIRRVTGAARTETALDAADRVTRELGEARGALEACKRQRDHEYASAEEKRRTIEDVGKALRDGPLPSADVVALAKLIRRERDEAHMLASADAKLGEICADLAEERDALRVELAEAKNATAEWLESHKCEMIRFNREYAEARAERDALRAELDRYKAAIRVMADAVDAKPAEPSIEDMRAALTAAGWEARGNLWFSPVSLPLYITTEQAYAILISRKPVTP